MWQRRTPAAGCARPAIVWTTTSGGWRSRFTIGPRICQASHSRARTSGLPEFARNSQKKQRLVCQRLAAPLRVRGRGGRQRGAGGLQLLMAGAVAACAGAGRTGVRKKRPAPRMSLQWFTCNLRGAMPAQQVCPAQRSGRSKDPRSLACRTHEFAGCAIGAF